MKTFRNIIAAENLDLGCLLKDGEKYFAHLKINGSERETLEKHTNLTARYFLELIAGHKVEPVIDNLISDLVKGNFPSAEDEMLSSVKSIFLRGIIFHDFGKINENFQAKLMQNELFKEEENGINTEHSILSSYLYLAHCFRLIEQSPFGDDEKYFLFILALLFSYPIRKHHGKISNARGWKIDQNNLIFFRKYLNNFYEDFNANRLGNFLMSRNHFLDNLFPAIRRKSSLFILLKLNSSLLTASDYYSTNEFMTGLSISRHGTLDEDLRSKIVKGICGIPYNKEMISQMPVLRTLDTESLKQCSNENLNILRKKLACEMLDNLRSNRTSKLFYIEAPTGSGKTNLSLLALAELLEDGSDITKVFYVFPFTSLITQTYNTIKSNLGLSAADIAEIHSKAGFEGFNGSEENIDETSYMRRNFIDHLFTNYPVCLLSHIKFFDVLISNEKDANYLLHRIANSVVIIDEVQSYNPSEWDKINYLIQMYSEALNVTFIVMSATLPKIGKLLKEKSKNSNDNFIYLIKDSQKYYNSPNFKNRAEFRFDYLENQEFSFEWLAEIVYRHSNEYCERSSGVSVLVEFLTKKSAHKFYEFVACSDLFSDYVVFIISGTVLEPRRREIISILKSPDFRNKKILVIATQVIEAGLDIDMDLGFKDKSIADSEEQFAGRINRNASKSNALVFLFNSKDSSKTYKTDLRYKQKVDTELYKEILRTKRFDYYYDKVLENINHDNQNAFLSGNLADFTSQMDNLFFQNAADKFKLIKEDTISVFVPLSLKCTCFSEYELSFLEKFTGYNSNDCYVDGASVWGIYKDLIHYKTDDFIMRQVDLKTISSIMSKFSFSMWNNPYQINLLKHYGEEENGFIYLSNYQEIYSFETGLKTDIETDCNFL